MHRRPVTTLALVATLLLAACGGSASASAPLPGSTAGTAGSSSPAPSPVPLTVGLGYIPSVQFAAFYLADQAGYYRDAGLEVTFQNKIDPDLVTLVGQGGIDVGLADGTSLIPAVSQGIPVHYLATIYRDFPSIVFSKASSGINSAADLRGKKIGIPGRYGSSWIMLQALLESANLTVNDVEIVEYPDYGQGAAVQQGAVDAATGFANNEPVQLQLAGIPTTVLHVDQVVPLPGPGLIGGTTTLATKTDAVKVFIAATLRAMADIVAAPDKGLDAAIVAVPELGTDRAAQRAVLAATIVAWQGSNQNTGALGRIDSAGWAVSLAYMTKLGLVPNPVKVEDLIRADLLPR